MPGHTLLGPGGPDVLVTDLDGTLLDSSGDPPPARLVAAVREAVGSGLTFALCTGRPTRLALATARTLGATRGYAIAYGGAETSELGSAEVLRRAALTEDARAAVFDLSRALALEVTPHESPAGTLRLVLTGEDEQVEHAYVALGESLGDAVCRLQPRAGVLAVQDAAATKLTALAALARRIGIDRSKVAYLGNGVDDAGALRWAGLGIAVAGDSPEAEAAADLVAPRTLVPELLARLAAARRLRGTD